MVLPETAVTFQVVVFPFAKLPCPVMLTFDPIAR